MTPTKQQQKQMLPYRTYYSAVSYSSCFIFAYLDYTLDVLLDMFYNL